MPNVVCSTRRKREGQSRIKYGALAGTLGPVLNPRTRPLTSRQCSPAWILAAVNTYDVAAALGLGLRCPEFRPSPDRDTREDGTATQEEKRSLPLVGRRACTDTRATRLPLAPLRKGGILELLKGDGRGRRLLASGASGAAGALVTGCWMLGLGKVGGERNAQLARRTRRGVRRVDGAAAASSRSGIRTCSGVRSILALGCV